LDTGVILQLQVATNDAMYLFKVISNKT